MLLPRKQASAKQDRQSNNVVNDQSDDDDEIKTDNIAEIPKVEREITFINEKIKSFPIIPQHMSPRHFRQLLLLTLELIGLALIHVHNYESDSHQSHLQGKPIRSPALPSHWLLLVCILLDYHYRLYSKH